VVARWSRSTKLTYVGLGDHVLGSVPSAGHLSGYVTSRPGQLSLAIPSLVGNQYQPNATTPCGWGVKADMVRVWVAGKTV